MSTGPLRGLVADVTDRAAAQRLVDAAASALVSPKIRRWYARRGLTYERGS